MTRREIAFLLIGLAVGLLFAEAAILEVLISLYRSSLIAAYGWDKVLVAAPILLLVIGIVLILYPSKI